MSSYLTTKHSGNVIVDVPEKEWERDPLNSLFHWLYFGPISSENFPCGPEGHKLCEYLREVVWREVRSSLKRVRDGEIAMIDIAGLCRLSVEDLDKQALGGDHTLRFMFTDFSGVPHMKYSENFVEVVRDHGCGAGLDFTEVVMKHVIAPSGRYPSNGPLEINPLRIFRTIGAFYESLVGEPCLQVVEKLTKTLQLTDRAQKDGPANLILPMYIGITMEITLGGIERVQALNTTPEWQVWIIEPTLVQDYGSGKGETAMRPNDITLSIRFTPAVHYDVRRQCYPNDGRSLYGFAKTLGGLIDLA